MGLIIAREVGEAFWVRDVRYVVDAISASGVQLSGPHGQIFDLSETVEVSLGDDVTVKEALRRSAATTRLMFEAARDIPIYRDELVQEAEIPILSKASFALLAPVPIEHLPSALETIVAHQKVAFGSRAWEVFREFEKSLDGQPGVVLIYASHDGAPFPPKVTWVATYLGHKEGKGGRHPDGLLYRPKSTEKYEMDNSGHWAIFWEVADLRRLATDDQIEIADLKSGVTGKSLVPAFRPEGPTVVINPFG